MKARDELVKANLKFVVRVAREYTRQGVPLADLISAGNIGLICAAERFDETRGVRFISYAVWWIRQAVLQTLADHARTVRLPSNRVELLHRVCKYIRSWQNGSAGRPPEDEIAAELGIPEKQVVDILVNSQPTLSLDSPVWDDEHSLMDLLPSNNQEPPDKEFMQNSRRQDIESALESLDDREREVIELYFGLREDQDEMTLEAIGVNFNLTRERVRQIKERALSKLRNPIRGKKLIAHADEI